MLFDWQTRCLTITEADRPGTLRLSAPMASRERVGHSVNIRRMLSYVEGPSSFKLANKSGPQSPSPRTTLAPSSPRSRYPSFASPSYLSLLFPSSPRRGREQLPPGSRRVPFIFYHRASSPLARLRVPPSLRLQVARNSLQPPPQPLRVSSFSFSSYLTVRPSVRSSEVRKYRLVCPMTRRLLLLLVSSIFFPPLERERENFFLPLPRLLSFFSPRVHRSPSPSLSPFSF